MPEPVAAPVEVAVPTPVPAPVAQEVQPSAPTAQDLAQIAQAGGDNTVTIVLALGALLGGGAAWKFYDKLSERKHEQAMEDKRLAAQERGLNGAQPPPCQAANAAIEARLAALTARVEAAEKKTGGLSADFDPEETDSRLKRLERAVKRMQEDKV